MDADASARVHVWCNPPTTELPLRASDVRFAVGTPSGYSSGSWKIWAKGQDVYVACRDDLKEFKVSLHASGIWRLGLTEQAVKQRPDLVSPGADRVMKKWRPSPDEAVTSAVYIVTPPWSLHLTPQDRQEWPKSVVFIEPEVRRAKFLSICIAVVRTREPLAIAEGVQAVVVGILPLAGQRSVQILATYEPAEPMVELISSGLSRVRETIKEEISDKHRVALFGERSDGVPWLTVLSIKRIIESARELAAEDG